MKIKEFDGWMDVHFYFIFSQTDRYHIVNAIILHNIWERWSVGIALFWKLLIVLCTFVLYCVIKVLGVMSRGRVISFSTKSITEAIQIECGMLGLSSYIKCFEMLLIQSVSVQHYHLNLVHVIKQYRCNCKKKKKKRSRLVCCLKHQHTIISFLIIAS